MSERYAKKMSERYALLNVETVTHWGSLISLPTEERDARFGRFLANVTVAPVGNGKRFEVCIPSQNFATREDVMNAVAALTTLADHMPAPKKGPVSVHVSKSPSGNYRVNVKKREFNQTELLQLTEAI